MKDKFYVYEHWRPDRGECFYVGMGCGRRANAMKVSRNRHHLAIQAKLSILGTSVEVRIIFSGLNKEDALAREIERIAFWRSQGADLTNQTGGGERGYVVSEESRQLMSAKLRGRKLTEKQKQNISAALKAKFSIPGSRVKLIAAAKKPRQRGWRHKRPMANDAREKIAVALLGNKNGLTTRYVPGYKQSSATIEKISKALRGRKQLQEHIEKRRLGLIDAWSKKTDRKHTPEAISKISASRKATWAKQKAQLLMPETVH